MQTTSDSAPSPEVLFIGPTNTAAVVRPLEKAGFKVVLKQPTKEALDVSVLGYPWRAILVSSSTPASFLKSFAKKQLATPVLHLTGERQCSLSHAANWNCLRQPSEGEQLVRKFVEFLSRHPVGREASLPSWVSQVLPATVAKSTFSKVLQEVEKGARVVVTKHETPSVVVVSYTEYEALQAQAERALDRMRVRFDSLVAEMQTPEFERGVDALFGSTPEQLGEAAIQAALSRD